ncbi:MAG TPA: calcium-binding protein [Baekduia sp.]|uniref:calcium-binding protein n=1 Tax=Baekduia sp. TaxID=2600305 RepID=UPI002C1C7BCA|nr:calcium-binding protein [Baekduia sp.]HMJ33240.1 calcium-binding protein [Baekduia sp.]
MTRLLPIFCLPILATAALTGVAAAKTSHAGWPEIDGVLKMHKQDQSAQMHGTARNDELLGGHGSDTIWGRDGHDVIWGDYKPSGQNETQVDHLNGGAGNEFIYASHGRNVIRAGAGNDTIHAHFGRGVIDCGSGNDIAYVSHKGRKGYTIRHCERISYKTLGY